MSPPASWSPCSSRVGILSLLAVVTLRQDVGAAGGDSLVIAGRSLVAIHDWTFLLGPGFVVGVGNGLILGYLMYRPAWCRGGWPARAHRWSADHPLGDPRPVRRHRARLLVQAIATIPEFFWELSLGIYLIVKGFKPSPILEDSPRVIQDPSVGATR